MAAKLKIIKSKPFDLKGTQHTHYTCAYKGRVFGVSTMRFEGNEDKLVIEGDTLTITGELEVLKNTNVDQLTGEVTTYLDIVPKLDIALAII